MGKHFQLLKWIKPKEFENLTIKLKTWGTPLIKNIIIVVFSLLKVYTYFQHYC